MKKRGRASGASIDALLFIDTNIFLDFYRVRGWEAGLSVLDHIAQNHSRIITGDQVAMEYKKNRQRVILESLGKTRSPDWGSLSVPTFLQDSKPNRAIETAKRRVDAQMKRLRARIERVLKNPAANDPVYRVAQALFKADTPLNLSRAKDERFRVRRLALKRFMLGYPPRKDDDTSIGDAINWEWIVRCATDTGRGVIIVSRDSDYGHGFQKTPILNDWLRQEFAERTSRRRLILLTDRLTEAFKMVSVPVTKQEERQEDELIEDSRKRALDDDLPDFLAALLPREEFQVISLALGFEGGRRHGPEEVAAALGIDIREANRRFLAAVEKMESRVKGLANQPSNRRMQ